MNGSTLYVKFGTQCALVKTRQDGHLLSQWMQTLDLTQFSSPKELCLAYLEYGHPEQFASKHVARTVFEFDFECRYSLTPVKTFDAMKASAHELMELDEDTWFGYLTHHSDHTWFVDLEFNRAYKSVPPPVSLTYLEERK